MDDDVPLVPDALQDAVNEAARMARQTTTAALREVVRRLLPDDKHLSSQVLRALTQSALGQAYVEESVPTMQDMTDPEFNTAVRERVTLMGELFTSHREELRDG